MATGGVMTRQSTSLLLGIALACGAAGAGCGSTSIAQGAGQATVAIGDSTFAVNNVRFAYQTGEGGYFRIEGDDAAHPDEDCLPGLGGGLALYGEMPSEVANLAQLSGKELPFEFTGDGDDFNLCFVGSNGLLGVEHGTVRFTVNGDQLTFTFSGRFRTFDGKGGESSLSTPASGRGTTSITAE
jgi:hypothetical protein